MRNEKNFIDNQFVDAEQSAFTTVVNPANGEVIAQVQLATKGEIVRAVTCAGRAQKGWRKLTAIERGVYLRKLADALVDCSASIGKALAAESGKSIEDATNEAIYAAEITRFHAEWARRIEGEVIPSDTPSESLLLQREPIGVVACLIPFNFPVYGLLRKIAPALITGNTVVVRPSNHTPSSAFEIARAVVQAGLPAGVVNIVAMDDAVAEVLCTHHSIGMITLTGSVSTGRKVLEYSRVNIAKVSLELGGKTPVIVEPDADLQKVAHQIVAMKTRNCGQICTSVERIYVQESVHDELVDLLLKELRACRFGDRATNPSCMGPLITERARDRIHQMVERACANGAELEFGGYVPEGPGYFYPPTLLTSCRQDMEIIQEETFGPVMTVSSYRTIDDALEMTNDHQYGLTSIIYTENYRVAMKVANSIEAGEIYINRTPADPYQGYHAGWKRSGLGGDDGKHGMLEFTRTRLVALNYQEDN